MTQPFARPRLRVCVHRYLCAPSQRCALAVLIIAGSVEIAAAQATRPPATGQATTGQPAKRPATGTLAVTPAPTTGAKARVGEATPRTVQSAAAEANGTPREGQAVRPAAAAMQVPAASAMDPAMLKVLKDWEEKTKDVKALYAEHRRFVYDSVFGVEKWGEGKVWYESPDKGRYEVEPSNIKGQVAKKKGFALKPHESEKWICTGTDVIQVNEEKREFEKIIIPPEGRGMNMMNGPLPFIIGMKAEEARKRYWLQLHKKEKGEIWVHARPRWAQDAGLWSDAIVILDAETFLPRAVQLTDPTGNQTTTHTFTKMDPRKKEFAKTGIPAFLAGGDPFSFNTRGYKPAEVSNPQEPGALLADPKDPKSGKPRVKTSPTSLEGRPGTKLAEPPTGAPRKQG